MQHAKIPLNCTFEQVGNTVPDLDVKKIVGGFTTSQECVSRFKLCEHIEHIKHIKHIKHIEHIGHIGHVTYSK